MADCIFEQTRRSYIELFIPNIDAMPLSRIGSTSITTFNFLHKNICKPRECFLINLDFSFTFDWEKMLI
jgi:hypothetical protein